MYADRTILSPVQGVIREEFMLTNAEVGLISSIFFIIYTTTVQIEMWYGSPPGRADDYIISSSPRIR